MADLSQLSDADLMRLYQIQGQETRNAPDSSTIQSSKGASGNMQVMPATGAKPGYGVRPSNGTPEDTSRMGDDYYLALKDHYGDPTVAAIAYNWGPGNTDRWLKGGADLSKVPNETLKYAYNFNKKEPQAQQAEQQASTPPTAAAQPTQPSAGPDYSKMSDAELKAAYAQQNQPQPSAARQRILAAEQAMKPDVGAMGAALTGLGETGAQMATGMFGQAAGALHGGAVLAGGGTYEQAKQALEQEREPVTYQPRTPAGQQISQNFGNMMDQYITQPLEKGGQAVGEAFGFTPEESKQMAEVGTSLFENIGLPGLLHGNAPKGKVPTIGAPGESVGKLVPDDAAAPSAAMPPAGPGPEEVFNQQPIPYRQYFEQPSLFDETSQGMQPEGPTLAGRTQFNEENPTVPRGELSNRRQMELQLEQGETQRVSPQGEVFPESLAPTRDVVSQRVDDMRRADPTQLDMFNDLDQRRFDQFGPDEAPRTLNADEFAETVQNLAEKDGTRFPLPEDMEAAYNRYLDMTRDEQGGLFDRPTIAENFARTATDEALQRRVNDHPVVKANQARLDQLMLQDQSVPGVARATAAAKDTLETSQKNIGKFFEKTADAATPFYAKDGTVHLYTFGYLPEMMKSLGALLKGIHGIVFKTLDRMIPSFKNLDSFGAIAGQGIKNFVNREATRDWSQTVNAKPIKQLGKIPGVREAVTELNPHAQDELSPEQLKQQFNSVPDLSGSKVGNALRNNLLQGGLMLSDFSQHPLVKYVTDSVAKAFRSSDKWVRQNLLDPKTGVGPMMKRMSTQEFTEIRTLMEAHEGVKEFSPNELKGRGYSDKQIEYYQRSLELQKEAFQKYNDARALAGLPPIDPRIAHIAAYFTGDFKQVVKDSSGRVIAVLGHNNRAALGVIARRFQEMHPDGDTLDMGKPELNKHTAGDNTFQGFMNILEHLGKNNADIQRLIDVYRDTQMANTMKLSQMANRGKFKSNPENTVGGAEGSKLWQSMEKNAQDGGKQQLKYLEALHRWSEFQKAIAKSQDFLKDPEINAPNAKAVSQKYLDNQMHRNLGELNKFTNSFVNGMADITGVGPSQMRQMANLTKTGLLNMFVGMGKFSHSLVTLIQPLLGIPEVNSVIKARGGNLGVSQFTSALRAMASVKDIIQAHATKTDVGNPFVRAASQYARDNDTFNTSQFNMGSINHQPTKLGNALHINVTVPESGTRAFTYMYYAHMLKDVAGDVLSDKEIFGTAHNAVQKVMADYNKEAQAPVFNKLGFLGDLTRMLTTFKMNQISQAATAGKMALTQGKVMPLVTMMATSIAAAGLRGFIGYNIANGLLGQITTWATKQGMMSQPTNLDQMILHMLHGMNPHLRDALNFGATSGLGIDMTGSLSHADDIPDDPLGTMIPEAGQIGKVIGSVTQFAEHPNLAYGQAAIYDALPNSLKGIMENMVYTNEKGQYFDPHTHNLVTTRSPTDQMKRNFSFRPLEESKQRLATEVSRGQNEQLGAVKSTLVQRLLSDADSKSLTNEKWQDYAHRYVQAGGDPRELVSQLVTHMGINKSLNIEQREAGIPRGFTSAERYQRAQGFEQK